MKQLKICVTSLVLLFFATGMAQTKKELIAPPLPPLPEIKMEKPAEPVQVILPELNVPPIPPLPPLPPPPPPTNIKGHPWTRNGQDVYVVKPLKQA